MTSGNSFKPTTWLAYLETLPWRPLDVLYFAAGWLSAQYILVQLIMWAGTWWSPAARLVREAAAGQAAATFVFAALQALVGLAALIWLLRRYHLGWRSLGWRPVSVWQTIRTVAAVLVGFIVMASSVIWLVSQLVPGFDANQEQINQFAGASTPADWILATLAMVVLPPILEESIFRGFAFTALAKRWGSVGGAVLSSALFALAHGQANVGVYTFVLGLLLCWLYRKFGSIVPGVLVHMSNNALAFWAMSHLGN